MSATSTTNVQGYPELSTLRGVTCTFVLCIHMYESSRYVGDVNHLQAASVNDGASWSIKISASRRWSLGRHTATAPLEAVASHPSYRTILASRKTKYAKRNFSIMAKGHRPEDTRGKKTRLVRIDKAFTLSCHTVERASSPRT